jgi:hypothetical protein
LEIKRIKNCIYYYSKKYQRKRKHKKSTLERVLVSSDFRRDRTKGLSLI